VKRALAALVMLGIATVFAAPSSAAVTVYGSAQLKYTVNATASVSIATNYNAAGAQGLGAPSILASAAGNCTAPAAEVAATLTFASITPPGGAGFTGCYYKNAISVGVLSNDASGVKVIEYADALATGEQICMFPIDAALQATPTASGASGNPGAYAGAVCPTVNAVVGQKLSALGATNSGGAGFGAAGNPGGTAVNANPLYTIYTAGGSTICTCVGNSGAVWKFLGQDIQLNADGTAASGAAANVITVAVIPQ